VLAAHRRAVPPPGPRPVLAELTDDEALFRLLDALRPEAVVHAAVIGRADECEARPDEAERVNARLPGTQVHDPIDLAQGRIVKSGGAELAHELEEKGYGWIDQTVAA